MVRSSSAASVLVSFLRKIGRFAVMFINPSGDGSHRKYRPEDHYMRGPGPKWREKHLRIAHPPGAGDFNRVS
jgi:hypothetical protein